MVDNKCYTVKDNYAKKILDNLLEMTNMGVYNISLFNIAHSVGKISDLVDNQLSGHHRRVAYIASRIAEKLNLSLKEQDEIVFAGLMHDIGALSTGDRLEVFKFRADSGSEHAEKGYRLLRLFEHFKGAAESVRYHHTRWDQIKRDEENIGGCILYLADRLDTLVKKDENILLQKDDILKQIDEESGKMFKPETVEALKDLSLIEAFWLDIVNDVVLLPKSEYYKKMVLTEEVMIQLGLFFSQLIDFRCRFTATHSSGIAAVASELAKLLNYNNYDCVLMRFAGYVHDIGKLAVPIEIIEKPSKLTEEEYRIMKMHTYYTYQILSQIEGIGQVKEWAAYHHERIDGTGYPFGIKGDDMSEGCKVMKVADVFTAITEERPYRMPMEKEQVFSILETIIEDDEQFSNIVGLLKKNYTHLVAVREAAQQDAINRYEVFIK